MVQCLRDDFYILLWSLNLPFFNFFVKLTIIIRIISKTPIQNSVPVDKVGIKKELPEIRQVAELV